MTLHTDPQTGSRRPSAVLSVRQHEAGTLRTGSRWWCVVGAPTAVAGYAVSQVWGLLLLSVRHWTPDGTSLPVHSHRPVHLTDSVSV